MQYEILASNWDALLKKMATLSKRADRVGKPAPIINKVAEKVVEKKDNKGVVKSSDLFYVIELECETIVLNGWSFRATVEFGTGEINGNILNKVPGTDDLPIEFRSVDNTCQHCNEKRNRNNVYIVQNDTTKEFKVVGTNCLAEFFGIDPKNYVQYLDILLDAQGLIESCGSWGGNGEPILDIRGVLSLTSFIIDKAGWLSSSKAREIFDQTGRSATPTVSYVRQALFGLPKDYSVQFKEWLYEFSQLDADFLADQSDKIELALEWARSINPEDPSDYLNNLRIVCSREYVQAKHLGILVSLFSAYKRATTVYEPKAQGQRPVSKHVGKVGEKLKLVAKLVFQKEIESQWGVSNLYKFEDLEGSAFTWFSKGGDMNTGETYDMTGTVKSHDNYQGVAQTVLTRCKILNVHI